ncbi:MAG: PLxRFG domain-containing protein [Pseudomonadota bacterium]
MRTAVRDSLVALEDRVGSIDEFVAQELGYDPAEIGKYFSAEQVDALGLALDQMKSGKGFIIGDQTGIGKGRVVAGVIRYALRNGYIPVFVTEKPNLYADMYRDLTDIGQKEIRPLMTNGGETVPLDEEGKNVLKTPASMKHNADLMKMAADADLGAYNMIFTTYNQMQTHRGKRTARMDLLEAFAPRAIVIFDESHNAGGTDSQRKNSRQKAADGTAKTGRAAFARQLAGLARGVFYSSATYAKRPSVMDLYFKTDMSLAVGGNVDKLPAAIQAGGVPLQQAVAAMLTKAGQYIRRERSFAGVEYNTPVVKVDRNAAETIASIMLGVKQFDDLKEGAVEILKKEAKATASQISTDGSTGAAGAMSTNFTSVMHNLIDQMLLGLKADAAADRAIEALRNGEKPVITVANTMGSFIESYADDVGLKPGDHIALSFKDLLLRYLEKSREVTIKDVGGNSRRRRMTDDELGAMAVRHFNRVRKQIQDATTLDGVPISPIDWIHYRLRTAGYTSSEITGRSQTIDYTAAAPTYRIRPSKETSIAGRRKAISDFNSGKLDAIILNQSGSTGLSLHASEKFKDQRRRRMIIAQAEKNIDTHMQMLGRVHRTGQVVPPAYDQLVADIPAEKRPAAVLAKKMASLNANTSAARSSALTSKESIDFLNEYGDEVVAQLMADMPEVHVQLGEPLDRSSDGDGFEKEDAARKVTGRIPMLPVKQQEELYDMIETAYRDRLAQADAMGENALEAKTLDLDARTVSRFNLFAGSEGGSPFAQGADVEVVDVKRLGKPYTSAQVLEMVAEKVGVSGGGLTEMQRAGRQKAAEVMRQTQADYENYRNSVQQKGMDDGVADNILDGRLKMLDVQHDRWRSLASRMYIGGTYRLTMTDGSAVYGLITNIERKKTVSNPVAMGAWRVTFAVADGARSITIPMSKLAMDDSAEGKMHVSPAAVGPANKPILELFDEGQSVSRERRIIVTGNLLAGFSKVGKGQIAHYTTADGRVQQGILMPRSFNLKEFAEQQPVILEPSQVAPFLAKAPNGIVKSTDGALSVVRRDGEGYSLATPRSKSEGGKYFLNQAIREVTGDFVSTSSTMRATVRSASDLERVLTIVQDELGQGLQVDSYKDEARSVGGKSFGDSIIGGSDQIQADVGESAGGAGRATALRLRKALNDKFGSRNVQNLINRGLLRIVPTFNNLPRETRLSIAATGVNTRRVRGAHDPKTGAVYLVASNIAPSEAASLILHEIGEHYGLKRMLGSDYARLLNAVRMQRHRDQDIAAAWRITKERYGHLKEGSDGFVSEVIARLADDASVLDKPLFRRIVDAIRRFLWRLGLVEVNANDIRAMLAASTRRVMRERALGREVSAGEPAAADLSAEEMIEVDGVRRPTRNSLGRLIHPTAEGVRAFWRWFGDSKVVDENGKPLVVYHGTRNDFSKFRDGPVWFHTDPQQAYGSGEGGNVMPAYVKIERPIRRSGYFGMEDFSNPARFKFFDKAAGQWVTPDGVIGDNGVVVAFSPKQVKSAIGNRGTFDPDNPNILFDLAGPEAGPTIAAVRQKIGDMLDTRRTFNRWWHSTVGTQYHKAQVDPDFGRVFNQAQEYLTDVSRIALAAAEAAPDILPRIDSLRDLARSGASPRELRPVADAIFRGTLEDEKVYTEQELREKFGLNTKQIGLYRQARRAIDRSLTDMLLTEMVKLARPDISDEVARRAAAAASPQEAREILAPYVSEDVLRQFDEKIGRVADLIRSGYAPLMRFGQYTLHVTGADGETLFFGMYESAMERNRMQRLMREQYPEATITAGVMNDESYQMFKGVSPETLELFATATGMDQDEAFQQYLKLTKSNRSALKRLIHRKGIEGYNPDLKRVLAQFITSNARAGSSNLHIGEMMRAWQAIPKEKGDVQKEAGRLIQYIQNPKEEAQALRGFLFYNFLGGSVASAAVNMTQPFTMSFPYLAQWGTARAARELAAGMRAAVGDPASIRDAALRAAMQRAIKEGTVEPHQIYELSAAAMRSEGDWGRFDKAREAVTKGLFLWGRLFSLAEQFNRRSTFAAAFQIGRELSAEQLRAAGVKDAYEFAVKAVNETQGIYNRGNRPSWARGAVGATLFTFKQFAISYMEFLKRLPRRERALALGVMFLAAGTQGLPGMEDLDDLIDTLLQSLGIATTAKEKRREVIAKVVVPLFGQGAMGFIENGASEFLPIDVQGRLGMGNLLPATGIGLKSTQDKSREIAEAVGPIGGVIENVFKGASRLSAGDVGGAAAAIAPVAVQNALKGFDMARMGFYRDERGRRVIDTTAADAAWKALGLQPQRVARESKMLQEQRRKIELVRTVEAEIADRWATGLFEGDQEKVRSARLRLMRWNRDNPEARIRIEPSQIQRRLREMRMSREERFVRSAPRELRPGLRAELAQ